MAAFRCTIREAGVPAYRHDWSWTDIAQAQTAPMRFLLGVWNPNGLGAPNVRVVAHPVLYLQHWLGAVLDPKVLLLLLLFSSTTLLALGTYRLARSFAVSPSVATVAGIVAAFGPATFDKFVAGHWYYLVAVAALPWTMWSACEMQRPSALAGALRTGALIGLTSLQPQIWVFAEVSVVLLVTPSSGRRLPLAIALLTGSVLMLPSLIGTLGAHSAGFLSPEQTIPFWERNNSAPLLAAPLGLGYFTHYAEEAYRALGLLGKLWRLLWIVPIGAIAGIVVARTRRTVWALAVLWVVAVLLVAGVYGPLGGVLQWLFANFLWASVFRELYHFALPAWVCACVLAAVAATQLQARWRYAALSLPLLAIVLLWAAPDYGRQLYSFEPDPRVRSAVARLAAAPGDDRFALLPAIAPLGPVDRDDLNGLDPLANPVGTHAVANVQETGGVLAAILQLAQRHDPRARDWLDAAAIGATIEQPGLRSRPYQVAPYAPPSKWRLEGIAGDTASTFAYEAWPVSTAFATSSLDVVGDPFTERFSGGFLLAADMDTPWSAIESPPVDPAATNLFEGWVRAKYWYWLDPQAAFWPDAAVTLSTVPLSVPQQYRDGWALVLTAPSRMARWLRVGDAIEPHNLTMVIGFAHERPVTPKNAKAHRQRFPLPFSYDCLCASGPVPPGARWIALKQSFDPLWQLTLDGGRVLRHVRYSAYGNAWQIATDRAGATYSLFYVPAAWWQPLIYASIIAWLAIAFAGVVLARRPIYVE